MAKCEKILLAGFSGAGKSTFLRELEFTAPESGWNFADLDALVLKSRRENEIQKLVENHGWDKFRLWERQELEGWLKEEGKGVLSLGGGALSQVVLDLFKPSKKIRFLYLFAPFEDCWERLHLEGTEPRPLLKLGKGELHRIYLERSKLYDQISWKLENPKGTDLKALADQFWKQISLS